MTGRKCYELTSQESQYNRIYGVIAEVVELAGLAGQQKFRFAVCVSEAFTNAFYHGNHADPQKSVKLEFSWSAETLEFRISDQGQGRVEELDLETELQAIDPQKTSGRGLAIMRGYADKFEVEEKVDGGLCFKLQWRLRAVAEIADRS